MSIDPPLMLILYVIYIIILVLHTYLVQEYDIVTNYNHIQIKFDLSHLFKPLWTNLHICATTFIITV